MKQKTVAVIGAGMVGVCCALYLQNENYNVTLIDKDKPGEAASSGNLGQFGIASCVPQSMPGLIKKLPRLIFDPSSPLQLKLNHFFKALPWFYKFLLFSQLSNVEKIAKERQSLLSKAHEAIDPLIKQANAENLVNNTDLLFIFENKKTFQNASYAFDLRRRNGVKLELLNANDLRQIEPMLTKHLYKGYRVSNIMHTYNPLYLVRSLFDLFSKRGGKFLQQKVKGFEIGEEGVRAINISEDKLIIDKVVLAAGVWSRKLAKELGSHVPLEAERGYHIMFNGTDMKLKSTIMSVDRYISITPMLKGIRAGGMAEFASIDTKANMSNAKIIKHHAQSLFPNLNSDNITEWMGPRPSHPDSKPVIDRSPLHNNLYFAFGHDHIGFTLGGITGKVISELIAGKKTTLDLNPFKVDRF